MGRPIGPRKVHRYSVEFKLTAVKLSRLLSELWRRPGDAIMVYDQSALRGVWSPIRAKSRGGARLLAGWLLGPVNSVVRYFLAVTVLLGPLVLMLATTAGQERIVNRQDADRIFGLNRSQWEAEARGMVDSQGWKVWPTPGDTGTSVMALDPRTGVGLAVQPVFRDQGPPTTLVVGSYYPAGTFRQFSEQTQRDMETAASSNFGPGYSVSVSFSTLASPPPGFDVVEVIITRTRR